MNGEVRIFLFLKIGLIFLILFIPIPQELCAQSDGQSHCLAPSTTSPATSLPPPPLMSGIGDSSFRITTSSSDAQAYFDQGLRLLHSFWDFEALRAFLQANHLDRSAAMPYWGILMSVSPQAGDENEALRIFAVDQLQRTKHSSSARERLYIDALLAKHTDERGSAQKDYLDGLKRIVIKHPQEIEAKLLIARAQMEGYTAEGSATPAQAESERLVTEVLRAYPNNVAAHHYWVHLMELSPTPERALPSVELLPRLAPNAGHIVHMPGHIYFLLGDYQQAFEAFIASQNVDRKYMSTQGVSAIDTWNYIHNLDYLIATAAELGRYGDALRWSQELLGLRVDQSRRKAASRSMLVYDGYTAGMRLHFRFRNWLAAVKYASAVQEKQSELSEGALSHFKALEIYSRGRLAIEQQNSERAKEYLQQLTTNVATSYSEETEVAEQAFAERNRKAVSVYLHLLRAFVAAAANKSVSAEDWLRRAKEIDAELGYREPPGISTPLDEERGWLLLQLGKPEEALSAFAEAEKQRPKSAFLSFARAKVAMARNDRSAARKHFSQLLSRWQGADPDLEQLRTARAALEQR